MTSIEFSFLVCAYNLPWYGHPRSLFLLWHTTKSLLKEENIYYLFSKQYNIPLKKKIDFMMTSSSPTQITLSWLLPFLQLATDFSQSNERHDNNLRSDRLFMENINNYWIPFQILVLNNIRSWQMSAKMNLTMTDQIGNQTLSSTVSSSQTKRWWDSKPSETPTWQHFQAAEGRSIAHRRCLGRQLARFCDTFSL